MKQLHFSIILSILLSMFAVQSYAHDIEVKNADGVPIYYKWLNGKKEVEVSFYGNENNVISDWYKGDVDIPASIVYKGIQYPVTSIGEQAFGGSVKITSVTIPNSVKSIGKNAFLECSSITSIIIPKNVKSIGEGIFDKCINLITINVEEGNKIYDSRDNCNAIIETATNTLLAGCQTTTIPNGVTSIGMMAFAGCTGLTSITIPNSVKSIGDYAFSGCKGLTSINIENGVTSIGVGTFDNCKSITSIIIPNSVTSIGMMAFSFCTALTYVTIGNGIATINDYVFSNCNALTSIIIPNSVTSIGKGAFSHCRGLTSITIGNNVKSIGGYAFYECVELKEVICLAENVPTTQFYVFASTHFQGATLIVPETSIYLYNAQYPWSDFGDIVPYSFDYEVVNSVIANINW